jgi:predicted Zn-dependent protease
MNNLYKLLLIAACASLFAINSEAKTIYTASESVAETASSTVTASPSAKFVNYKYYDKPWLLAEPPKELTLNEYQIGLEAQKMMESLPVVASSPLYPKLQAMVDEIASATPRPGIKYTVKIVENEQLNAFTIPGGVVYVYTGLLKKVESDDELAGVLAHEIAHNVRFHVLRKIDDSQSVTNTAMAARLAAIAGILAGDRSGASQMLGTVAGIVATAILSESSIPLENEADYYGYEYLKKTHYNPVGELTFMEKLAAGYNQEAEKHAGIYMTHPFSKDRVANLTGYMKKDNIDISAGRRKVLSIHSAKVKEYKLTDGSLSYIVAYNGINLLLFAHNTDGKARADDFSENLNKMLDESIEPYQLGLRKNPKTTKIVYKNHILYELSKDDMADNQTNNMDAMADSIVTKLREVIWQDSIVIHRTEVL